MNVTENQASQRWCPMIGQHCLGSECMIWRWAFEATRHHVLCATYNPPFEPQRPENVPATWEYIPYDPSDGDPAGWLEPASDAQARSLGYCGLAAERKP